VRLSPRICEPLGDGRWKATDEETGIFAIGATAIIANRKLEMLLAATRRN